MITITIRPEVTPTEADVAKASSDLARIGGRPYAYATGYLGSLIATIAESHNRCRTAGCSTCWNIRRGLALIAAVDRIEADSTIGGVS